MRDELILKERNTGMDVESPIIDEAAQAEDVIVPEAPASDPTAAE